MNLTRIKLKNFLSHVDTDFTFPVGVTVIEGKNGAGKSTLVVDGPLWGIWGVSRSGIAGDDLIHDGEDTCRVTVEFTLRDELYKVIRERHRGTKTTLKFYHGGVDLSRSSIKNTQSIINRTLGFDGCLYRASSCLTQTKDFNLAELDPKDTASIIMKLTGIDIFDNYKKVFKEKLDGVTRTLSHIADPIVSEEIKNKRDYLRVLQNSVVDRERSLKLAAGTKLEIERAITEETRKLTAEQELSTTLKAEEQEVLAKLNMLGSTSGSCYVCASSLSNEVKIKLHTKLNKSLEAVQRKLRDTKASQEYIKNKLTDLNRRILALGIDQLVRTINTEKLQCSRLEGELSNEPKTVTRDQATVLRKAKDIYSALVDGCDYKGMPLILLKDYLEELETLANKYLHVFSGGDLTLSIHTRREGVDGRLIESINIVVYGNGVARPYATYSGGQKMMVDFSLRIGLSEFLAYRNNFKLDTITIDEGLGCLDDSNQQVFISLVQKLGELFTKVILITHTDVRQYFRQYVRVHLENNRSRLHTAVHV